MQSLLITSSFVSGQNYATTGLYKRNNISPKSNPVFSSEYPDLKQYNIPKVGEYYCGPVSAANSIIDLSQNGFPQLYKSNSDSLIYELARYFKTDEHGTTTNNLCTGIEAYINSKGYQAQIKYQGLRPTEQKYFVGNTPDFNWIKQELGKKNTVILNLGVYRKEVKDGKTIYKRHYGHFVNVTGKNINGLNADTNYLSIYDPYDRVKGEHYIKITPIIEGTFINNTDDNEARLTDNAAGFLETPTKFSYFNSNEIAIIDGVISLEVKK